MTQSSPCYGLALVLPPDTFSEMMRKYYSIFKDRMNENDKDFFEIMLEPESYGKNAEFCPECAFEFCEENYRIIKSECEKEIIVYPSENEKDDNNSEMVFAHIDKDYMESVELQRMDTWFTTKDSSAVENGSVIFWADKGTTIMDVMRNESYEDWFEIVMEFQYKFRKYLPDDFDWNRHIGYLSFAATC